MSENLEAKVIHLVHMNIQDVQVCFDLKHVKKIFLLPYLEGVPRSKKYIAGIMNVTGKTVFAVDLGMCLDINRRKKYRLDTPVILCESHDCEIGFIVDNVFGLINVSSSQLQVQKEFNESSSLVRATVSLNGTLALLVDVEKIMANYMRVVYE